MKNVRVIFQSFKTTNKYKISDVCKLTSDTCNLVQELRTVKGNRKMSTIVYNYVYTTHLYLLVVY